MARQSTKGISPPWNGATAALWRVRRAVSCSARRSRRNMRTATRGKPAIRTIPQHTPGGSSSGSAAAVADGPCPSCNRDPDRRFGDTAGFLLRRYGYKPSYPVFRQYRRADQHRAVRYGRNHGPFGRRSGPVQGGARRNALCAAASRGISRPRIGFCRTPQWDHASAGNAGRDRRSAQGAEQTPGAEVVDLDLPDFFAALTSGASRHLRFGIPSGTTRMNCVAFPNS